MSTFATLPGVLNIKVVQGDTFSCDLDFTTDMTGYSTVADVYSFISGATIVPLTVTEVSEPNGQLKISLTKEQTASIPRGTYRWRLIWTSQSGEARMALSGFFEISG